MVSAVRCLRGRDRIRIQNRLSRGGSRLDRIEPRRRRVMGDGHGGDALSDLLE